MGLIEDVAEIKKWKDEKELSEKVKEKKWKFPFGKKVGKSQRKKNYLTTLIIQENGTYDFKKYEIIDQTIIHDMIPRLATAGHVMYDKKGNPMVILPNWSVEPFSPLDHLDKSLVNGKNTKGYKILLANMLKQQVTPKAQIGGWVKWVVGLGLGALIVYALISGGGK